MPTLKRDAGARKAQGSKSRISKDQAPYHHGDLRSALLTAGRAMLAETGPSTLSLRELARRLGVSHNAPYKHFATREALLAALAAEGFKALGMRSREATGGSGDPEAMGLAYIGFALDEPAVYRLMFSDFIDKAAFPDLQAASRASFEGLRGAMERAVGPERAMAAAVSAWAMVHGLSLLLMDDQIPAALAAGRSKADVARLVLRAYGRGGAERK